MNYRQFEVQCGDGLCLFACEWRPEAGQQIKAVITIVHGMGEHAGRYAHAAEMFAGARYAVLSFDQRGHGRTAGKRGHTPSYEALLEGVDLIMAKAERSYPGMPKFIYGHSMGGNVTLNYLLRRQPMIAGAIVTGPWLRLAFQPPVLQAVVGRMVERVYPQYTNTRPMVAKHLTSDPEMIKRYTDDPYGHGDITAGFFFGVQRAGEWALKHAAELSVPLLLMHGTDDKVTSIEASRKFAERAGSRCTFMEWPGFRHELQNELGREEVFAVMRRWLEQHLGS